MRRLGAVQCGDLLQAALQGPEPGARGDGVVFQAGSVLVVLPAVADQVAQRAEVAASGSWCQPGGLDGRAADFGDVVGDAVRG